MPRFSKKVEGILIESGWHEGRKVPIESFLPEMAQEGFEISPAAKTFLEEFGGLYILYSIPSLSKSGVFHDMFGVHPKESLGLVTPMHAQLIGAPIWPIGNINREHVGVAMAPDGRVFAMQDETVFLHGYSGDEALTTIIMGGPVQHVTGPTMTDWLEGR